MSVEIERLAELSEKATQGEWNTRLAIQSGDIAIISDSAVAADGKPIILGECFEDIRRSNERAYLEAAGNAEFIAALVNWFRANLSALRGEPVLPCEVVVGNGHFHVGIAVSTLQGAIDRMFKRMEGLEAERREPREAIAWAVTWKGLIVDGNIFGSIEDAGRCMDKLDAGFPNERRELMPLFRQASPSPSRETARQKASQHIPEMDEAQIERIRKQLLAKADCLAPESLIRANVVSAWEMTINLLCDQAIRALKSPEPEPSNAAPQGRKKT